MKTILMLSLLMTLISCDKDNEDTSWHAFPSSLEGGTWISQQTGTDTVELVFTSGKVEVEHLASPVVNVTSSTAGSFSPTAFMVYNSDGTNGHWRYFNLQSNSVTICFNNVTVQENCLNFTR